jgi:hypothetical protein
MPASRRVGIVFPENSQIKIFRSIRSLSRYLDCTPMAIVFAIKENRRVFGYEVFYA